MGIAVNIKKGTENKNINAQCFHLPVSMYTPTVYLMKAGFSKNT